MPITATTGTLENRASLLVARLTKSVLMACLCGALAVCPRESYQPLGALLPSDSLDDVLQRGTLRVVSRVNPATFVIDEHGPAGIEYELARAFAERLGVELRMLPAANISDVYAALDSGKADIAASGLSATSGGQRKYVYSSPYFSVTQQVLYRSGSARPSSLEDLLGKRVMVLAQSVAADTLRREQNQLPGLSWMEAMRLETFDLLKKLDSGSIDYAIVNSNEFYVHQGLFPKIELAFELKEEEQLSWATSLRARNARLHLAMQEFFASYESSGNLDLLREHFFGHLPELHRRALNAFARRVDTQLPRIEKLIRRIAGEEGMDWRMLASISYQESHWNPRAVSRTGVVGMMMLTQATATEMGVNDRSDMEQSLRGGARYFRHLLDRMPTDIAAQDRALFALAAYNMGLSHVEDARVLTQQLGQNPDRWIDVRNQLPLLAKRQWYAHTRHGYARGFETANFVNRIRQYHRFLTHRNSKTDLFQIAMNAVEQQHQDNPDRT